MNEPFSGMPSRNDGDALAVLIDRRARRARIRAVERVGAAAPAFIDLRLAQLAPVVAEPPRVIAARPRHRRRELQVVKRLRTAGVEAALLGTERHQAASGGWRPRFDGEARNVRVIAKQRQRAGRIAELGGRQLPDRVQIVVEPQPAALHVEKQRRREDRRMPDGVVVVEPVRAAARDFHAVDLTREVVIVLRAGNCG